MTTCPNCGHKWTAAKKKKASVSHLWTVVEFADGITILRSGYCANGDYSAAIESAQRMRAAAMRDGDYTQIEGVRVPRVAQAYHVDGPQRDKALNKAFAQREVDPAWGKILSSADASWTRRRANQGIYG